MHVRLRFVDVLDVLIDGIVGVSRHPQVDESSTRSGCRKYKQTCRKLKKIPSLLESPSFQQYQAAIREGLDLPRRVAMECCVRAMNSRAHSRRCR